MVVSALIDSGPDGVWAEALLGSDALVAPHLMPAEVANVLCRAALAGDVTVDSASLAHADLLRLRVGLFDYEPFAERVWALRDGMSAYDAWYVALAESLDAPVATLDRRLTQSPGARCQFIAPDSPGRASRPSRS